MTIKIIGIIILLLGMNSCVDSADLEYLSSISESDESANGRIRRQRSTRSTNQCEDSDRCENICDQMLDYSSEKEDCYRLSLREIGRVEEVFDVLKQEEILEEELEDIRGGDFDLFASLALSSWSNVVRGEYRGDELDDEDDTRRAAYTLEESRAALNWIITHKSIAESIRDFSGRNDHIVNDLLVRASSSLSCSGTGDHQTICDDIDGSSLTDNEKRVLESVKLTVNLNNRSDTYLGHITRISSSDDEVSAIYELTHDALSRVCENTDSIGSYGRSRSSKICLSWIYFCPASLPAYNDYSFNQIDQYLLQDTYRDIPQNTLFNCTFLSNEPEWSDYWD